MLENIVAIARIKPRSGMYREGKLTATRTDDCAESPFVEHDFEASECAIWPFEFFPLLNLLIGIIKLVKCSSQNS